MSEPIVVLILSSNRRNLELLTQVLQQANYEVIAVKNYTELKQALSGYTCINLGLIDLAFDNPADGRSAHRQIWNYCEQLQSQNIPFLTFTPQYSRYVEQSSLAHGASSVLVKPLVIKNLLLLVQSLVKQLA